MSSEPDREEPLAGFSLVLAAQARLQIVAVLSHVREAEFARLRMTIGASDSVTSKHLAALAAAGFIRLYKRTTNGRPRTWASLTRAGRMGFDSHVRALRHIVNGEGEGSLASRSSSASVNFLGKPSPQGI